MRRQNRPAVAERDEMVGLLTDQSLYWVDEQLDCEENCFFEEDDDKELP
ncbi:hypothetical protein M3204_11635 [Mesobacillus subterraneus]|nr:hypothetical protein [Mesobacillus subterraneus]